MRQAVRVVAAALAAAAGLVALGPLSAGADAPYQAAWWNRLQVTPPGAGLGAVVPPPPNVPEGGLYVAGQPVAPFAFSALRFAVEGVAGGTLTLVVANGTATGAVIDACAVTGSWSQGGNQDFATAPTYDCASKVVGEVSADGASITWQVPAAFHRAEQYAVDVALLPGGEAASQVAFAAPGDDAFVPGTSAGGGVAAGDTSTADGAVGDPASGSLPLDAPAGSFDLSPLPSPSDATPGATAGAAGRPAPGAASGRAPGGAAAAVRSPVGGDDRGERVMAVVALLLLGGAVWWFGGKPLPAPRLLGGAALADANAAAGTAAAEATSRAPVGGIGRFARPRTARPSRL